MIGSWHVLTGLPGMVAALPWPVILASIVVGMIIGAWLGKVGVAAVLTIGTALFFIRRAPEDKPQRPAAPPRKTAGKRRYNPDTNTWE